MRDRRAGAWAGLALLALLAGEAAAGPGAPGAEAGASAGEGKGVRPGGRLPGIGGRRILQATSGVRASQAERIAGWRAAVEGSPGSVEARMGLARALAGAGRCREALEEFGYYLDATLRPVAEAFGADEALAAAQCAAQLGWVRTALRYDGLALELAPDSVRALTVAAVHRDMAGDAAGRDEALLALETGSDRGGDPSLHARALIALQRGDLDALDLCGALWERAGWDEGQLLRLETRAWLDVGDPVAALAGWREAGALRRSGARALFAEALRRSGDPVAALAALQSGSNRGEEDLAAAVLSRILADQGDLSAARFALNALDDSEEVLASRWYLATFGQGSAGGQGSAEILAERWARLNRSPLRRLEDLRPI